jgi:HK97 family phage prohead protease
MSKTIKKNQPMGTIRSLIEANVNEEDRTVELVFTTGSKGLRSDWDMGPYYEELSMDSAHLDMSRLKSGSAPLLAAHNSYDLNAVIGVVERAWIEGNEGKAVVRFSSDPDADKIFRKVKEKVLRNVSIGYQVRKYQDVSKPGDKIPTLRAVDYSIHEISIVPIGFDQQAQVRSKEIQNEVEIETLTEAVQDSTPIEPQADLQTKERQMTEAEKQALELAAQKQAKLEEKTRQLEIRKAAKKLNVDADYTEQLITNDVSVDEARKLLIEKSEEKTTTPVQSAVSVEVSENNSDKRRQGFEEALLARIDRKNFKVTEGAKEFMGKGLLRSLELVIPRYAMESDIQYAKRTMSSSDLPLALANVAEKSLQAQYNLQPRTFEQWSRQDTLRNYKEFSQVKSGDYGSLVERPEGDEFQQASFSEDKEIAQLKDYGIIHAFTSQMLVNDDLGVLSRMASQGGVAVSRLENRLAYLALTTNKLMNDGLALYENTVHKNLGSSLAINATSVAEAYKLMRKQTTTDGRDTLNLVPKFLVCGPDKEVEARSFFSSISPNQTSQVNIFQNSIQVIVDGQLTGNQYYFIADPSQCEGIVCYRLEGQEQPSIESRTKFETNSLELKIAHAFAAEPMDWRAIVKNAGA